MAPAPDSAGGAAADAAAGAPGVGDIHLVSWNVAGWKTTLDQIKRFGGGLPEFLRRHHVDILCLQEVKLAAKAIAADSKKLGAEVPGFETYWACNEGSGAQRQGLNGITTFARRGSVLRADSSPLQEPDLDCEGRCLLTDHGAFVVFNVYVPNSAGGPRLPFKMRWLRALRAAMTRAREAGKAVILAGDLNLKNRPKDSHWTFRPMEAYRLHELARSVPELSPEARTAADTVGAEWPGIAAALRAKELRAFETKNAHRGQTYKRWGVFVKAKSGEVVRVGSPIETEEMARFSFLVDGCAVETDGTVVQGPEAAQATYTLQSPGNLSTGDLAECLKRIAGVELPQPALKALSDTFGRVSSDPAVSTWLRAVLDGDGMADSFAELRPEAEERFTCWDQYKNKRHENVGSRIDYILVDRPFFECHARRGEELQSWGRQAPDSAAAALAAATMGGLSQPTSFAGGGMAPLSEDEYFAQFRAPSTGMIYTPPQLSDHIAVSLLLTGVPRPAPEACSSQDAVTLRCQPYRTAKRITDFFAARPPAAGTGASSEAGPPAKRAATGAR